MSALLDHATEEDWSRFYQRIAERTGLNLADYKPSTIRRRVESLVRRRRFDALDEFVESLNPEEIDSFRCKLGATLTELYRDAEKWQELKDRILPGLYARSQNLKCWSAGSSFGAEAYTLAILLDLHFEGKRDLLVSDIDYTVLNRAREGVFALDAFGHTPMEIREAYFERLPGQVAWRAVDRLRQGMRFAEHNLLGDPFEADFDLIVCRNVAIYFTEVAKDRLWRKISSALKPGGALFVGIAERVMDPRKYDLESPLPGFYLKKA